MARYQGPGLPAQVSLPCRGCNPEIIQKVLCMAAGLILWLRLWTDRQGKMGGQIQRRTLSSLSTNTALEHGTQPPTPLHLVTQTPPAILVRQGPNDIVNRLHKAPFC